MEIFQLVLADDRKNDILLNLPASVLAKGVLISRRRACARNGETVDTGLHPTLVRRCRDRGIDCVNAVANKDFLYMSVTSANTLVQMTHLVSCLHDLLTMTDLSLLLIQYHCRKRGVSYIVEAEVTSWGTG